MITILRGHDHNIMDYSEFRKKGEVDRAKWISTQSAKMINLVLNAVAMTSRGTRCCTSARPGQCMLMSDISAAFQAIVNRTPMPLLTGTAAAIIAEIRDDIERIAASM